MAVLSVPAATAHASAAAHPARAAAHTPAFRLADIAAKDGVVLKADVFTPAPGTPGADAQGRYPAIVQPASWGQNDLEYVAEGRELAARGYVAVTYTVRGFWLSGGQIDVAGPDDVRDISSVVDWTLAHTPADPRRLGMAGLSLGGGLALMGAAFDPRLKAVAAMSGWGDLADALDSGDTRHLQAAALLAAIQAPTGRLSPETRRTLADLFADRDMPGVLKWARTRSPATYADRINAHGTAVLLANAWGDSFFNPSQILSFYRRLTVPKKLELRPGDHATQELTGLLGLDNTTWRSALAWFDQRLKGAAGHDGQPVELSVRPSGATETYPSWPGAGSRSTLWPLAGAQSFTGGLDTGADGGIAALSGLLDQVAELPPVVEIPLLPRWAGAVWQSSPYAAGLRIRGIPRLHTTVTASCPDGTVFAYLYDVNAFGLGKLITHAPQSWSGAVPGRPFPLDVGLFATAYDLPAGHRLALVLDTEDPLYASRTPLGSRITVGSRPGDPSQLALPVR